MAYQDDLREAVVRLDEINTQIKDLEYEAGQLKNEMTNIITMNGLEKEFVIINEMNAYVVKCDPFLEVMKHGVV